MIELRKARKTKKTANIMIYGPTGSGKSLSSIAIMAGITHNGKFVVIDAEYERADFYGKYFDFDIMPIKNNYHPELYIERIDYAIKNGYQGVIIDTLTQSYVGKGGILDIVDSSKAIYKDNVFSAWKDATYLQEKLIHKINSSLDIHRITIFRAELKYRYDKESKKAITLGLRPIFREKREINYEFDSVFRMTHEHELVVETTRFEHMADKVFKFRVGREGIHEAYRVGELYVNLLESVDDEVVTNHDLIPSQKLWDYFKEKQLSRKSVHSLLSFVGLVDENGKFKSNLFTNKSFELIKNKLESFEPKEELSLFLESELDWDQRQNICNILNNLNSSSKKEMLNKIKNEYKVDSIWNLDKNSYSDVINMLTHTGG